MSAVGQNVPSATQRGDPLRGNVLDVALARAELLDLGGIHVEAQRVEAGRHESPDQGQAHVAQTNHAHRGLLVTNSLFQRLVHTDGSPVMMVEGAQL